MSASSGGLEKRTDLRSEDRIILRDTREWKLSVTRGDDHPGEAAVTHRGECDDVMTQGVIQLSSSRDCVMLFTCRY